MSSQYSPFSLKDLIINDQSGRASYRMRASDYKYSVSWGQRKLLLGEIEFFCLNWNSDKVPNPLCVYAGAAPGTHIVLLSVMFPEVAFHLYDPNEFDPSLEKNEKISIFKEIFTEETAMKYSNRNDVFFISDIRVHGAEYFQRQELKNSGYTLKDDDPLPPSFSNDSMVRTAYQLASKLDVESSWKDMLDQQEWVKIIDPAECLLKFRLPYALDGEEREVGYLKGIVYWQPWTLQSSTECRLKPERGSSGKYEEEVWSSLEYEEWCFYHNTVDRETKRYLNPFTDEPEPIASPELMNDYDSTAEAMILRLYLTKRGKRKEDHYSLMKDLSALITLSLNRFGKIEKSLSRKRETLNIGVHENGEMGRRKRSVRVPRVNK